MTTAITASPTKLRSGNWGAKIQGAKVREGDTVTITTRSGKSWDAEVVKVVWSGSGVSICATESLDRRPPRRRPLISTGESCGYRCPVGGHICTPDHPCHDCL